MKVKIKYVGKGLVSRGTDFSPTQNDGLYDIEKEDADYLLKTFPDQFVLIERTVPKKQPAPKAKGKKEVAKDD
jgi:hypothetical protein